MHTTHAPDAVSVPVLAYTDITSRTTFNDVEDFHDAILRVKDANSVPFMLVGNKADMEEKRVVQKSELEEKAKKLGCKFMETSAKSRQNVDEIFTYATPVPVCVCACVRLRLLIAHAHA
jgi:GTPase SAR1 family protein